MLRSAAGTREQPRTNVAQKGGLNRSISRQAWSLLRRRTEDKAATWGVLVVAVDPRHTSQTCHRCGTIDPRTRESQARFHCRHRGHAAHAHVNAANNILAAGLAVTVRGGTPHQGPLRNANHPDRRMSPASAHPQSGNPDGVSRREEVKNVCLSRWWDAAVDLAVVGAE
jgi:transposase